MPRSVWAETALAGAMILLIVLAREIGVPPERAEPPESGGNAELSQEENRRLRTLIDPARTRDDPERAAAALRILSRHHRLVWDFVRLGQYETNAGNHREASVQIEKAAEIFPTDSYICVRLANSYLREKRVEKAAAQFQRCLDLDAADIAALRGLAGLRERAGSPKEAIDLHWRASALGSVESRQDIERLKSGGRGGADR
ncbi:MAG: hypothetical protein ACRD44_14685 [Bryobacteraceae bacterium]